MTQYRKKPVVVEAFRWQCDLAALSEWLHVFDGTIHWTVEDRALLIPTLEGVMTAQPNDWIIRGVKGEFYPCKPDIFAATYEPAAAPAASEGQK